MVQELFAYIGLPGAAVMTAESDHDSPELESLHSGEVCQTPECQVSGGSTQVFAHGHDVLRLLEHLAELQVPDVGSDPPHLLQLELLQLAVQLVSGAGPVHQHQLDRLGAGEGSAEPVGERATAGAKLHESVLLQQTCLSQVTNQGAVLDMMLENTGTWDRTEITEIIILIMFTNHSLGWLILPPAPCAPGVAPQ